LGVKQENLRWRVHTDDERSFYSRRTEDLEYNYPFGFKELWGLAYRTDYDLSQHEKFSGKELRVVDSSTGQKILPHVIEPAVGVDRMFLMVLSDAYFEEDARIVLKIAPRIAPVKVAVFPLLANKEGLMNRAREIYLNLKAHTHGMVMFDARGNIGKRYLSQDEIGTPFCVTVDFESLENDTVTVRERDSAEQVRVKANELVSYITKKIE
jgi:glycyl-tRNA synthetase